MADDRRRSRGGEHAATPTGAEAGPDLAGFMRAAGLRYWAASILPVLIGSTLPFWLRPNGLAFSWVRLIETLAAAVFIHAGSALVRSRYRGGTSGAAAPGWPLRAAAACYAAGAAIGLHLNAVLPGNFMLALGCAGALGGFFYSAPPLRLSGRGLGEIVLAVCLGVLPVAGGYYTQTGAISWNVCISALPSALALTLWLWVREIRDFDSDRAVRRTTLVVALGRSLSARAVVPVLSVLIFASLFLAVFTASMIPLALVAVLAFGLVRTVVAISWNHHDDQGRMFEALDSAFKLYLAVGIVVAGSALAAVGS